MHTGIYILIGVLVIALLTFKMMFIRYRKKSRKALKSLERQRLNHEISILKNQMSPHFILNTINNISTLIETDPIRAQDLLIQFGELLRYSTYDVCHNKVELTQALNYLEKYIELQRLRLKHAETLQFSVRGNPANKSIAPMMLLPFIENAFKYGKIGNQDEPAIQIEIIILANTLHLSVTNSINTKKMQTAKERGIGIENTKKRLQMIYPNQHDLHIARNNGHFHVELEIKKLN